MRRESFLSVSAVRASSGGAGAAEHAIEEVAPAGPEVGAGRRARERRHARVRLRRKWDAHLLRDVAEVDEDAVGVDGAVRGILLEEGSDQGVDGVGRVGEDVTDARRDLLEVRGEPAGGVARLEGRPLHEHLEHEDAERVEVGGACRVGGADALRGHVLRGPEDLPHAGEARVLLREGDPEVEQLHAIAGEDEDVLGLEIAVDDVEVVSAGERAGHLDPDRQGAPEGHAALADRLREGRAREQLHHHVRDAVLGVAVIHDLDDVGVNEPAAVLDLAQEALAQRRILGELRVQELQRADALEQTRAGLVDRGHAALADPGLEHVAARDGGADPRVLRAVERDAADEAERAVVRITLGALGADLHSERPAGERLLSHSTGGRFRGSTPRGGC